jgi:hypothetical protein
LLPAHMPSPFPGMNPYLEAPYLWAGVHHWLITALARSLNAQLRPRYYVAVELHVYQVAASVEPTAPRSPSLVGIPDNVVLSGDLTAPLSPSMSSVATLSEPIMVTIPVVDWVEEGYLEVRLAETHEVITTIEILSPTNKQPGKGRLQYEEKRQQLLAGPTHLVEIDLMRKFQPMEFLGATRQTHYRILVCRAQQRPKAALYGFNLSDSIPIFPLPLQPGDEDCVVALKPLLDQLYDEGAYELQVDYTQEPPDPKLSTADLDWCREILGQPQR